MSNPALPVITLTKGIHRVEIFDPRPDPRVLGARYVQGGYIRAWWAGDRQLTSRAKPTWNSFHGEGLPETFELGLGWSVADENDEYLRIGAGRLRRKGSDPKEQQVAVPLVTTVEWTVVEQTAERVMMRCHDHLDTMPHRTHGYTLERAVELTSEGPISTTRLTLRCPQVGYHPLVWFAHPFFAQTAQGATGVHLPLLAHVIERPNRPWEGTPASGTLHRGADGCWRFAAGHPRSTLGGLWGSHEPLIVHLDPATGGGQVAISVDRPLDHVVVWASDRVFSPEPKLSRVWLDGETADWTIRYRFLA